MADACVEEIQVTVLHSLRVKYGEIWRVPKRAIGIEVAQRCWTTTPQALMRTDYPAVLTDRALVIRFAESR